MTDPDCSCRALAPPSGESALRGLYELMKRVHANASLDEVLDEVARGVVDVLGFQVAAISRREGEVFVMTHVAAPPGVREQILGRRTPISRIYDEYDVADRWGVLRYIPRDRLPEPLLGAVWIPDLDPSDDPEAWHPLDTLYAPLTSAEGDMLGNLSVDLPRDGRIPGPAVRELLEIYVVQAGLAMDNAQQRERLAEQVRMEEMLRRVSSAGALAALDLTVRDAGEAVRSGLAVDDVWIRCFPTGANGPGAVYPAEYEASHEELVALAVELAREAWSAGLPVLMVEGELEGAARSTPERREVLDRLVPALGDVSVMVAPVGIDREVLGYVVVMRWDRGYRWSAAEQEAMMSVGRTLGRVVLDGRLYERERHLVTELQELDRYREELIATISHELKTPLTSIIGHAELLADVDTGAGSVEAISRNAHRLDKLIANLLRYSAVRQPRTRVRVPVDLRDLARSSIETLAVQAALGGVELDLTTPTEAVLVSADGSELGSVVDNLVSNAVKYTPAGGSVQIVIGRESGLAVLTCIDTGLGISVADQQHLFSAFHRSSNPAALSIPGTGLGLAIARRVVQLHGGHIGVSSHLGRGSTFRLELPEVSRGV